MRTVFTMILALCVQASADESIYTAAGYHSRIDSCATYEGLVYEATQDALKKAKSMCGKYQEAQQIGKARTLEVGLGASCWRKDPSHAIIATDFKCIKIPEETSKPLCQNGEVYCFITDSCVPKEEAEYCRW